MSSSIIQGDAKDRCFLCSRRGHMDVHHMLHGSRRYIADKYGLVVHICRDCHRNLHDKGIYDRELMELAQVTFENRYSPAMWSELVGKNYRR